MTELQWVDNEDSDGDVASIVHDGLRVWLEAWEDGFQLRAGSLFISADAPSLHRAKVLALEAIPYALLLARKVPQ